MKYIRSCAGGVALLPSPGGLSGAPGGGVSVPHCVLPVTDTSNSIVLAARVGLPALPSCRPHSWDMLSHKPRILPLCFLLFGRKASQAGHEGQML